jgi:hypothetical protein
MSGSGARWHDLPTNLTDSLTGVVIEQVAPIRLGTRPRSACCGVDGDGRTGACSVRERRDA